MSDYPARDEDTTPEQDEVARRSRQTGGDAPAAGSIEERENLATDEDALFDEDDEQGEEE